MITYKAEYEEKVKQIPSLKDKLLSHIRVHKTYQKMENETE